MEANYITLDGTEVYINEDQICISHTDVYNEGYYIITMSCGERLCVKPIENNVAK